MSRSDAVYWAKDANAVNFPDPVKIGEASGQADFSNTSITVAADGTIYYAWDDNPTSTIYMRMIDASGNLGPIRVVDRGSRFPLSVEVAVSTNNEIFITWRDPDDTARLRRSSDGGVSWAGRARVSDDVVFASPLDMRAGPNGKVAITYTAGSAGKLQIFTGLWDSISSNFVMQRVTNPDADYADSSVTFTPDGTVYTSWRGVAGSGGGAGVFYAQRQSDGSWPRSRLVGGQVTGTANLDSDEQGNLHLTWIAQPSGGNQLYYAFKPAIDSFRGPIAAGQATIFNPHSAASGTATGLYAHVVSEFFSGSKLFTRYSLFKAEGAVYGATPEIEGGAAVVGGKSTVQVTFSNFSAVNAATTQVRWRWNAAPTDSVNDSGGWKSYAATITVPIPPSIINNTSCAPSTLYTQLRDTTSNLLEDPAKSDTIMVDGVVQGSVDALNPFINIADAVSGTASTAALLPELALSKGATSGGDPNYTRVPLIYLNAQNDSDCTGISSIAIGKSADALEVTYKSDGSGFSGLIPLPDLANLESGPRPVVVQVRDGAGNLRNYSFTITYDDTKPTMNPLTSGAPAGSLPVTTSPHTSSDILQDITFTNIQAFDTQYGGRHFWGVWVANSRTAPANIGDPLTNSSLKWKALPAPGAGDSFTLKDWSLATGLTSSQLTSGSYYLYFRLLDGAGNASDQVFSTQLTSNVDPFKIWQALVAR